MIIFRWKQHNISIRYYYNYHHHHYNIIIVVVVIIIIIWHLEWSLIRPAKKLIRNQPQFQVSTRSSPCTQITLLNIGRVTPKCICLVSLSPTANSLPKSALLSFSREIKRCCSFHCAAPTCIVVLLFSNKGNMHFFTILLPNNRICDIYGWFYCKNAASNIICHQVWSKLI